MSCGLTPCRQLRPSSRREHVRASNSQMGKKRKGRKGRGSSLTLTFINIWIQSTDSNNQQINFFINSMKLKGEITLSLECRARKIACPTSRGNKKFQSGNCNFFTYVPAGNHAFIRYLAGPGFSINIFVGKMGKINKWEQGMLKLSAAWQGKKCVQGILL